MLQLGQEEEGHDPTDDRGATPHIATLARQIPARGIQHLGGEVDHRDLGDVVGCSSDARGQGSETHGGGFGDDGVGDGTEGAGEDEGDDYAEDGLRVVGAGSLWDGRADAEDEEEDDVGEGAPEVDCAAAEPGG